MFAAHLAAGLAIKAVRRKAPAWAVLTGAFLPDVLWIGCAGAGIEPASDTAYFDGWSHSVTSIVIQAALFSLCFLRLGRPVVLAIATAVLSHLLLDMPIHPQPLELWPHAPLVLGHPTWAWGQVPFALAKSRYWWIQLFVVLPLLAIYAAAMARRQSSVDLVAASCLVVVGMHLIV